MLRNGGVVVRQWSHVAQERKIDMALPKKGEEVGLRAIKEICRYYSLHDL